MPVASKQTAKPNPRWLRTRLKALCPAPKGKMQHFALAVSGGADSLSMMVLAHQAQQKNLNFTVLSFNHNLRPEAANEARYVAKLAKQFGLPVKVLSWQPQNKLADVQAKARMARYEAMLAYCARQKLDGLILAHHLQDQAETFLQRLIRGSSVDGLSAMQAVSYLDKMPIGGQVPIVRPFLETDQAALHQCLTASGLQPVQDPSNSDNRFQRVLLRENRAFFDGLGLTAEKLAATASRLQPARAVLQQLTQEALNQHLQVGACGQISFERAAFQALPQEIGIRFLRQIFSHHQDYAPRQARLEAIYQTICDPKQHKRQTLAGLMCDSQPHQVIIYREPAAIDPTPIIVKAGQTAVWDRRFVVKVSKKMAANVRITPLGAEGAQALRDKGVKLPKLPAKILHGLPCVRAQTARQNAGKWLAVPKILSHPAIAVDLWSQNHKNKP